MKKVRAYSILMFVSVILLSFLISSTIIFDTSAYDQSTDGNQTTARQKEWYSLFSACISKEDAWDTEQTGVMGTSASIPTLGTNFRSGAWFDTGWFGYVPDRASPWVEKQVTGSYDDGKIRCGENDNQIVAKAMGALGLENLQVACDYNNPVEGGVLDSSSDGITCRTAATETGGLTFNGNENDHASYFEKLVKVKTFSNSVPAGSISSLTNLEKYFVLYDTFTTACIASGPYYDLVDGYTYQIYVNNNGTYVKAGYDRKVGKTGNENIVYFYDSKTTCNDIASTLGNENSAEVKALKDYIDNNGTEGETGNTSDNVEVEANCNNSAGSLGWILCAILEGLSDASNEAWVKYIQPALEVKTNLINENTVENNNGEDEEINPTLDAWETFRNFSNIIFIIFFLFVIFSQLTGVGIDNYGIKKLLPKLIVTAVLVNLSYLICQLSVDLSNILGSSLYNLMNSMGDNFGLKSKMTIDGSDLSNINWTNTVLTGVAMLVALAGAVGAFWNNGIAVLIPLLVGALSVAISIAFLFILLSVRQAGVVVLVVVSPIAFICYLLPNSKKLFDKWFKALEGLLLLYPICGLLVGGGNFVSKLLLKTGEGNEDFFLALTAMIVCIAPIFFIPTLLRGAFAAIGNIGNTISNLGNRVGKGVSSRVGNGIKNSETLRRADNFIGRHQPFSKKYRARAASDTAALTKERATRSRLSDKKNLQTRIASIAAAEEAKAVDEATAQRLSLMMSAGDRGGITLRNKDGSATRVAFTLDNAIARVDQLREASEKGALNNEEKLELAALSRGLAGMKGGGASKLGGAIREANKSEINANFMSAMGEIYSRDSVVKDKLGEKDPASAVLAEQFIPGTNPDNQPKGSFADFQKANEATISSRIKTYSAGLNQGGAALDEFVNSLSAADTQKVIDDDVLMSGLDIDARNKVEAHAKNLGVKRSVRQVEVVGGNTAPVNTQTTTADPSTPSTPISKPIAISSAPEESKPLKIDHPKNHVELNPSENDDQPTWD